MIPGINSMCSIDIDTAFKLIDLISARQTFVVNISSGVSFLANRINYFHINTSKIKGKLFKKTTLLYHITVAYLIYGKELCYECDTYNKDDATRIASSLRELMGRQFYNIN
jgi:hypothetical protein